MTGGYPADANPSSCIETELTPKRVMQILGIKKAAQAMRLGGRVSAF